MTRPTALAAVAVTLGCATALTGVFLLAGLAMTLVVLGVVLAAGGLLVDV